MAAGLLFQIKRGDLTPTFRAQCLDDTTPVDLAPATSVKFIMRIRNNPTPKVTAVATKEDQTTARGWVHYTWVPGDTDTVGDYRAEIEVTWSDGKLQTFPAGTYATVSVLSDLG
jgi:hypothetical protein